MPKRCVAARCNTASGQGYSLHKFPHDDGARSKLAQAIKLHRVGWKGPTAASFLCSKHFEPDCFITEGVRFHDAVGIPAKKLHRVGWKGPTAASFLCSKHFEPDCFITEGVRFCDAVGIPAKKRLKPSAIPTIFPKSDDNGSSYLTTPLQRPASERQK